MAKIFKATSKLKSKIKEFEGCKLTAYKCPAGVWTIGVGHTKGVRQGQRITERTALEYLAQDLKPCEEAVNNLSVCSTQGQFNALVDFVFNLGETKLQKSTLLKKIKAGAPESDIRYEFSRWIYSGGKKLAGLVKRRQWEADTYFS